MPTGSLSVGFIALWLFSIFSRRWQLLADKYVIEIVLDTCGVAK